MDMPLGINGNPAVDGRVFGIARRVSSSSPSHNTITSPVINRNQTSQPPAPAQAPAQAPFQQAGLSTPDSGRAAENTAAAGAAHISNNWTDKSVELARWMGKSPLDNRSTNGEISSNGKDDVLKIERLTGNTIKPTGQPFEGLVAQLKRSSGEVPSTAPPYKRVV